jgi:hypothetical protein
MTSVGLRQTSVDLGCWDGSAAAAILAVCILPTAPSQGRLPRAARHSAVVYGRCMQRAHAVRSQPAGDEHSMIGEACAADRRTAH